MSNPPSGVVNLSPIFSGLAIKYAVDGESTILREGEQLGLTVEVVLGAATAFTAKLAFGLEEHENWTLPRVRVVDVWPRPK